MHTIESSSGRETATVGMWVFLASELMFFGPLFAGYLYGRTHYAVQFADASQHTRLWLGTANTALLLTSSLSMALAARAAAARRSTLRWLLLLTGLLGAAFLCIKAVEYAGEWHESPTLFLFLYFAMTGLHAVHLTVGIGLVWWAALRSGALFAPRDAPVELIGLYWHFVDVMWIFLFPMFYLLERYR